MYYDTKKVSKINLYSIDTFFVLFYIDKKEVSVWIFLIAH